MNKDMNKDLIGGKAVEMGEQGCIFIPNLKCVGEKRKEKGKGKTISKLMLQENAIMEIDFIKSIQSLVTNIPNHRKYFILEDINICQPDIMTQKDLENFDRICLNLVDEDITAKNIKQALDDLLIITMPYGGIDVSKYLRQGNANAQLKKLYQVNLKFVEILNKVIVPLNKNKIYHNDIKANNFLIDSKNNVRLIDWGLSFIDNGEIPPLLRSQPIYFPHPVSSLLFTELFKEHYNYMIYNKRTRLNKLFKSNKEEDKDALIQELQNFLEDFIRHIMSDKKYKLLTEYFMKHFSIINSFSRNDLREFLITSFTKILLEWTDFGKYTFDYKGYFNKIYKRNLDCYSLILTYIDYVDILNKIIEDKKIKTNKINTNKINTNKIITFRDDVISLLRKYVLLATHKPIDVKVLSKELLSLNKTNKNKTQKKRIKRQANKAKTVKKK